MASVKPAKHSENISDLKTGLKWKLKHHADYLHRGEFHHHIYSLPDLSIRQTGLENINEMSILFTSQNSCEDHEAGPVCFKPEFLFVWVFFQSYPTGGTECCYSHHREQTTNILWLEVTEM